MAHFLGQNVTKDNLDNQEFNGNTQQDQEGYTSRIAQERDLELNNALNNAKNNDKH